MCMKEVLDPMQSGTYSQREVSVELERRYPGGNTVKTGLGLVGLVV